MKIQSIKRGSDYVRFNFDVTVEVSDSLVITTNVFGDYNKGDGPFKDVVFINVDDVEWPKILLFGEEAEYKGFKDTFNKLFKKDFEEFNNSIDEFATKEVHRQFTNTLAAYSSADIRAKLKCYVSTLTPTMCRDEDYRLINVYDDWCVNRVVEYLFGTDTTPKYRRVSNECYTWGFKEEMVLKCLR